MNRTFAYGAAAAQGRWPVQEDGFLADPGTGLFFLADGFGGRGNGDIAAKLALREAREAAAGAPVPVPPGAPSPDEAWQWGLLSSINKKILSWNEGRPPQARGGCSLVSARVEGERGLSLAGCGACSALLFRMGRWLTLLAPQAPPAAAGQPLLPSQALGLGGEVRPECRFLLWQPGDLLLLLSGGLAWGEGEAALTELAAQLALRAPGGELSSLLALSLAAGGEAFGNQAMLAVEALGAGGLEFIG